MHGILIGLLLAGGVLLTVAGFLLCLAFWPDRIPDERGIRALAALTLLAGLVLVVLAAVRLS